jgi:hypothetical protein
MNIAMANSTRGPGVFPQKSEFDDFLFAQIGEDGNQAPLSVLSALARLNFDPWVEAGLLSRLSRGAAAEKLASMIESLPNGVGETRDVPMVAARLIALLPARSAFPAPVPSGSASSNLPAIALGLAMLAMLLGAGWSVIHNQAHSGLDVAQPTNHAASDEAIRAPTPTILPQ